MSSRVALITGAARRLGAEIAQALHAAGINTLIHYHTSENEAKSLVAELNQRRPNSAGIIQSDLTRTAELPALVEQAANPWGRLDILINNASYFARTPLGEVTEHAWDQLLNANLKAPFFLAQAAIPYLAVSQGCIVNIADIHGQRPMRDYSAYCISKAGLLMLTQVLAKELGGKIRVNAVAPGPIIPPEGENALSLEQLTALKERTVLKRVGSAKDVAEAVLFLVQHANFITGQVINVDGGRSLRI